MALSTFASSEGVNVRILPASVVAVEEVSATTTRVYLSSGHSFLVMSAIASVVSSLGL